MARTTAYTDFNLAQHVLRAGLATPDKVALSLLSVDTSEDWSFDRLTRAVRGTGTGLRAVGLAPGDVVLMRLGNTPDFPIAYLGALAAGLVPVPTATALTEGEVARLLPDLRPAAILHDPDVPCPPHPSRIDVDDLRAMQALPPVDWHLGDPDRLGYIIYTSGTSGRPTAVMHAHRAILARQMMFDGWYGLRPEDRMLHAGAFNWTFTLGTGLMDPWTMGATALIPAPGTQAADLPELMARHGATLFAAAPGVYRQMLKGRDHLALPALRHGLSAGEKLNPVVRDAWTAATGTPVYEAFGMSECSTFISGCPDHPATPGALGRAQAGRQVAILTETGPAATGEVGTIAIHRSDPGLMLGYLNAPQETAARYLGDWFLTGDQGEMLETGQIRYLGRDDDMMNAGGFRVSPIEVETALAAHPGITQVGAATVEVKPDTYVIAAFYCGPEEVNTTELADFASSRLARYKQPRAFVHLDSLPMGANGKLLRRALPALFEGSQQ